MNIYGAIIGVMGDIGAIGKEKKNSQQGFMYRGVDDVMNALQPLLVKHKVFIVPNIIRQAREERQTKQGGNLIYSVCDIEYTFYAEDGSSIKCTVTGEGMDSGDKATNKAMAIAFKYACFQVFCIPTEEMKDPDSEVHEVKPKTTETPKARPEKQIDTPAEAEAEIEKTKAGLINKVQIASIEAELERTGVKVLQITINGKKYNVADLSKLNFEQWKEAMGTLETMPDKPKQSKLDL
jgi:hypothetical protein